MNGRQRRDQRHRRAPRRQQPRSYYYPLPHDTTAILTHDRSLALQHPGLAFQRFVPYERCWSLQQEQQKEVLSQIGNRHQELASSNSSFSQALDAIHQRIDATIHNLVTLGWHAESLTVQTEWRLVVGLGSGSVLEGAGMVLHRLYGFPYLPGSGVKGLTRAYRLLSIQESLHPTEPSLKDLEAHLTGVKSIPEISERLQDESRTFSHVFGKQDHRGSVMFMDALPLQWPLLEVDITNVHYRDYYMNDTPEAPGDYMSPNPVYFLTIVPQTSFRFVVLSRSRDHELVSQVKAWIVEAVQFLGVGAKTRAGYGYLSPPQTAARAQSEVRV